jgi:hypothetical protein
VSRWRTHNTRARRREIAPFKLVWLTMRRLARSSNGVKISLVADTRAFDDLMVRFMNDTMRPFIAHVGRGTILKAFIDGQEVEVANVQTFAMGGPLKAYLAAEGAELILPLDIGENEDQFLEHRRLTIEEIARIFSGRRDED